MQHVAGAKEIMSEETTEVQTETPAQEEQVGQVQSQENVPVEKIEEAPKKAVDRNWEEVHKVLKLQKQKIEELESRVSQKSEPIKQEEPDEFANLDPEEYITAGKAKALAEKLASKQAEKAAKQYIEQYARQQNVDRDETRMRSKHEDYDYVVKNYVLPMIENDPALAYKIQQSKNPAETAYKLGKISDEYTEDAQSKQGAEKAEKILKNSSRPVSSSATGSSLKAQADNFSKMSRSDVWAMSQQYAKGA